MDERQHGVVWDLAGFVGLAVVVGGIVGGLAAWRPGLSPSEEALALSPDHQRVCRICQSPGRYGPEDTPAGVAWAVADH